jgi:H/ACA ribonucleoprotein complex subunit 3
MSKHIMLCKACKSYTMSEICKKCDEKTIIPRPPKYSPEDKYSKYRRIAKRDELMTEGLL